MSLPIHLIFAAVLLASAIQGGVKWNLWQQKGAQSDIIATYNSRTECRTQAKNLNQAGDGFRYICRAR